MPNFSPQAEKPLGSDVTSMSAIRDENVGFQSASTPAVKLVLRQPAVPNLAAC